MEGPGINLEGSAGKALGAVLRHLEKQKIHQGRLHLNNWYMFQMKSLMNRDHVL